MGLSLHGGSTGPVTLWNGPVNQYPNSMSMLRRRFGTRDGASRRYSNLILIIFGFKPRDEANSAFTLEQVEEIVSASQKEGTLADGSGTIVKTFEFTEKTVADVAVPLDKLIALSLQATPADLQAAVAEHGFSRYPVTGAGATGQADILGYWHIKDGLTSDPAVLEKPIFGWDLADV